MELVLVRLSSRHEKEASQELKTQARSCARKQTHGGVQQKSYPVGNVSSGSRGHHTFNSVFRETSQVFNACQPATSGREVNTVNTNTMQFAKLFIVSHELHCDWFRLSFLARESSTEKKRGEAKFLRAGSFFTKGRTFCNTLMTLSRTGSVSGAGPSPGSG